MSRILVIGGEDLFETVRGSLATLGYAIERAANSSEATRRHAETPADLVIAGPGCADGTELDALLGLIRDHPRLKIVTVSEAGAEAYLEGHAVASALGALATISQPIEAEELLFHVLACLGPLD
jgi:DNA-binding NtrC family response regulator